VPAGHFRLDEIQFYPKETSMQPHCEQLFILFAIIGIRSRKDDTLTKEMAITVGQAYGVSADSTHQPFMR
jgi:hypothetical protein